MIRKAKAYFAWEKDSFQTTKGRVAENNRATLMMLLYAMVAIYACLLVFGLLQNGYSSYQAFFGFMLAYMLVCLVLVVRTPSLPAVYLTYGVDIVTVLLCLYASAFVDPDYVNAEAYVFFLLFPILCLDSSLRIDAVNTALTVIYLINIFQYKSGKPLALEAMTVIGFSALGMAIGHFVRFRMLKVMLRMEKSERAELREGMLGLSNHNGLVKDLSAMPMTPQAVVFIRIDELLNPARFFGLQYDERQLRTLGDALKSAAEAQGIELYLCGGGIVGMVQPRMLEGVFQRLEPLHHLLNSFEYRRDGGETVKLHFGIGAALCEDGLEDALNRASEACDTAQKDGKNRIVI